MRKRSKNLFKRLIDMTPFGDNSDDYQRQNTYHYENDSGDSIDENYDNDIVEDENDGPHGSAMELPIDLYETGDYIYVVAVIGGARKSDIDLFVTRESVSIIGKRMPHASFSRGEPIIEELYWGDFAREIQLPDEINVDEAEAKEESGLLIVKLPKINKNKRNRIRIN